MAEFSCTTKILCFPGALDTLADMGSKRTFMVADPFFVKEGIARDILNRTGAAETEIFQEITPDPTVLQAAQGTARLKSFAPDLVVALGGGSAMDCAKAMVYFSDLEVPLVAIPTTSGSGSEVTDFAILTHEGVKHPLIDPRLTPRIAILDDALLKTLPPSLIADAGFDILTHAVEACVAKNAGAFTDALATEAFCRAYSLLPASYAGRQEARLPIHAAATMAGLAFNRSGLGLCHAMAHALGGRYHIPHGRLNGILLPAVIRCNQDAAAAKYAHLAQKAGLGGSSERLSVRALTNGLIRLRRQLGLPETLRQTGISPQALGKQKDDIVKDVLADPCCSTNPATVEAAMVLGVLDEVMGRG